MAKIVKGSDFKGVVDYILDKNKGTRIVARDGLFMENKDTIAMSFNVQSQMNSKVAKPVGHIALSFSKEDEPRLTGRAMASIALEYMERMGIRNTQFFIARHLDKEHPHVHIAYNRIDNDGNTISDRNGRLRSTRICKELTLKYGLYMSNGKENVKRNRLKEPDKTKYELYDILKTEVGRCGNWGRACRQPEAAWCGSAFQTQGTDQRGTGCRIHQKRLPFQRLQSGQAFQLFQD